MMGASHEKPVSTWRLAPLKGQPENAGEVGSAQPSLGGEILSRLAVDARHRVVHPLCQCDKPQQAMIGFPVILGFSVDHQRIRHAGSLEARGYRQNSVRPRR